MGSLLNPSDLTLGPGTGLWAGGSDLLRECAWCCLPMEWLSLSARDLDVDLTQRPCGGAILGYTEKAWGRWEERDGGPQQKGGGKEDREPSGLSDLSPS